MTSELATDDAATAAVDVDAGLLGGPPFDPRFEPFRSVSGPASVPAPEPISDTAAGSGAAGTDPRAGTAWTGPAPDASETEGRGTDAPEKRTAPSVTWAATGLPHGKEPHRTGSLVGGYGGDWSSEEVLSVQRVCEALGAHELAQVGAPSGPLGGQRADFECRHLRGTLSMGSGRSASLFWLGPSYDVGNTLYLVWPRDDGGTDVLRVGGDYFGINWDGEVLAGPIRHVRGFSDRLSVRIRRTGTDASCTRPLEYVIREEHEVICERKDGIARCTVPIPRRVHAVQEDFSEVETEHDEPVARVIEDFELRIAHREDGVELTVRRGELCAMSAWKTVLGERRLDELLDHPVPTF